ncbi:ATP-binding protein [Paenibacillus soyae]|uniref:histidine kinase n=1 Tax=Paenibacillus soyae TaxID=2969249 RepID=A0A9X2MNG8_9BACL|nr:ATP-binding protein [Paenibacillus soyae]MCR2805183.1 PAS domain S-box protein [Paenibacillus soyae]
MSIKAKLSVSISIIVAVILALNIIFSYLSSKAAQESALDQRTQSIAKQLVLTLETLEEARVSMDAELGEKLRMAAIAAQLKLDPDIGQVSSEQLREVSEELGLDDITLWQRIDGEVQSVKSSNPDEVGMRSATWDYWDRAFHQLFDRKPVDVGRGQTLPHYWSGPINFAVSDPSEINKWGYYYDGSANYMINTIVNAADNFSYDIVNGTNEVIQKLADQRKSVLEIAAFDPQYFGSKPIIKMKKGIPVYNLDVRDIPFGSYTFKNPSGDTVDIQNALNSDELVTSTFAAGGKELIRAFVPIQADKPYVIGVTFDRKELEAPLRDQLLVHSMISIGLVLFTMAASYFIAGYMLRSMNQIIQKVNAIAAGHFEATITIRNKDELGTLAARVNSMGVNLHKYTTQLQDAARELQHTKQYLESFVGHTSDAIHVVNLDGRIQQVNHAFETIYGWSAAEAVGWIPNYVPQEHLAAHKELFEAVKNGGSVTDYETVHYTRDGGSIDVSMTISSIRDEEDRIVAIATITRNITSRKQAEEMIRRSEKLAVVGQLAAGVAHEVRNPLTTIRGFVQLQKQVGSISPSHLDVMLSELDQINRIVSEFLVFSKPAVTRTDSFQVSSLISDILMLMDSEVKKNGVGFAVHELSDSIPDVAGVGNQLKQVFVNVVKNGLESMAERGGELRIEIGAAENGGEVLLRFIDQGVGISPEDLSRIGEPFFTRKTHGNGLGVMICQQIIAGHGGTMTFASKLGEGTCVEIRLPARIEAAA